MSQDEPSLIRPDHPDAAVSVTGGDAGIQAGFKPEHVPHIHLPDPPARRHRVATRRPGAHSHLDGAGASDL